MASKQLCRLSDLRVDLEVSAEVNDKGWPIENSFGGFYWDGVNRKLYWCYSCATEFHSWDKALAHLAEVTA